MYLMCEQQKMFAHKLSITIFHIIKTYRQGDFMYGEDRETLAGKERFINALEGLFKHYGMKNIKNEGWGHTSTDFDKNEISLKLSALVNEKIKSVVLKFKIDYIRKFGIEGNK